MDADESQQAARKPVLRLWVVGLLLIPAIALMLPSVLRARRDALAEDTGPRAACERWLAAAIRSHRYRDTERPEPLAPADEAWASEIMRAVGWIGSGTLVSQEALPQAWNEPTTVETTYVVAGPSGTPTARVVFACRRAKGGDWVAAPIAVEPDSAGQLPAPDAEPAPLQASTGPDTSHATEETHAEQMTAP